MKFIYISILVAMLAISGFSKKIKSKKPNKTSPVKVRELGDEEDIDFSCNGGDVEFELITGYVYFVSDFIIDSKAGELELEDCINYCRQNTKCHSINFETGLCVLLKYSAGEKTELLQSSQFPVFTIYAQKVCLLPGSRQCDSPWVYETVPGLALTESFVFEAFDVESRFDCVALCLSKKEYTCRSASYNREQEICTLSQLDRNMPNRMKMVDLDVSSDYIEVSCTTMPQRMCEFKTKNNMILRTVDAVIKNLENEEQCRAKCLEANFTCYTYDFMIEPETVCRLSHHSSATLAHIRDPYLEVQNSTTYELHSCYQVSVECKGSEMLAKVTTSKLFDGKVYVKNRPNSCVVDVQNTVDFEISLPYNDVDCDVVQEGPSSFTSDIVIQHHDMIVTSADIGLALNCRYDLKNTTVSNSLQSGLEVKGAVEAEYFEETVVSSPNVTMIVSDVNGHDIFFAQVGDNLALRFEIPDKKSPYEIFVRQLIAMDGQDSSEILLIDGVGCPTDLSIMQSVIQVGSGKVLHAPFQAFKFPSTDVVQFRALVTPCMPKCEPVNCTVQGFDGGFRNHQSYGRKRREVQEHDIMVAQTVRITDKFSFTDSSIQKINDNLINESCSSFFGLIATLSIFLVAQVVVLMAWSYLWHQKKSTKQVSSNIPTAADIYFGTISSRTSSKTSSSYLPN